MKKTSSYVATLLCATSLATITGCAASTETDGDDSLEANFAQSSAGVLSYEVETKIVPAYMSNDNLANTLEHGLKVANVAKKLSVAMLCEARASEEATILLCSSPLKHGAVDVGQYAVLTWDYKSDTFTAQSSVTKVFAPGPAPANLTAAEGFFLGSAPAKGQEVDAVSYTGKSRSITWSSKGVVALQGLSSDPVKNPFLLMKPTSEALGDIKAHYQPVVTATGRTLGDSEWSFTARQSPMAGHIDVYPWSSNSKIIDILGVGTASVTFLKKKTDITSVRTKKSEMLPSILKAIEAVNDDATFVKKP